MNWRKDAHNYYLKIRLQKQLGYRHWPCNMSSWLKTKLELGSGQLTLNSAVKYVYKHRKKVRHQRPICNMTLLLNPFERISHCSEQVSVVYPQTVTILECQKTAWRLTDKFRFNQITNFHSIWGADTEYQWSIINDFQVFDCC